MNSNYIQSMFLRELNKLLKKHKVKSISTGEQGAIYREDDKSKCFLDDVFIQFEKDEDK